jgi:hypothetical protein
MLDVKDYANPSSSITSRFVINPSSVGIDPVKVTLFKLRNVKIWKDNKLEGIVPSKPLLMISSDTSVFLGRQDKK